MPISTLSANNWKTDALKGGIIIDVRTPEEHAERHISAPHAHVPLDVLNPSDVMLRHGLDDTAPVYLLCRGGKRAMQAAEKFAAAGFTNLIVIEGGLMACETAGHAVEGTATSFGTSCAVPTKTGACS